MRVLITGISSYIGKFIAQKFIKKRYNVIGISRSNPKINSNNFSWCRYDISKSSNLFFKKNIDFVVHVAGNALRDENTNLDYVNGNIIVPYNLEKIMRKIKPRCVFYLSTREVYGEINSKVLSENNDILNPIFYGQSKYLAEKIFEQNYNTISLRLSSVLGIGTHGWISHVYKKLKNNIKVEVMNADFNNFIYVGDVFNIIYAIIKKRKFYSDQFNICCSNIIKSKKVVEIMKKKMNSKSKITQRKKKGNFYTISYKKISKIHKTMTVEKSILRFLADMKN